MPTLNFGHFRPKMNDFGHFRPKMNTLPDFGSLLWKTKLRFGFGGAGNDGPVREEEICSILATS